MKPTSIIPGFTYKNAPAAIEWLCEAFGFEKHLIVPGEKTGIIAHAQLTLGSVMIMLGSSGSGSEYSKLIKHPSDIGGFETQSPYILTDDPDAMYNRAKQHGAKIAIEIKTEEYGGRGFSCYDLEGHLWNFGSYDPWKAS